MNNKLISSDLVLSLCNFGSKVSIGYLVNMYTDGWRCKGLLDKIPYLIKYRTLDSKIVRIMYGK